MATYTKPFGSVGTTGLGVKVGATVVGSATTIHTVPSDKDIITIYAVNNDTDSRELSICFGGVTVPDNIIPVTIPARSGFVPVVLKLPLGNGLVVKAFASVANMIVLYTDITHIA